MENKTNGRSAERRVLKNDHPCSSNPHHFRERVLARFVGPCRQCNTRPYREPSLLLFGGLQAGLLGSGSTDSVLRSAYTDFALLSRKVRLIVLL